MKAFQFVDFQKPGELRDVPFQSPDRDRFWWRCGAPVRVILIFIYWKRRNLRPGRALSRFPLLLVMRMPAGSRSSVPATFNRLTEKKNRQSTG
jgi:hypothetical protein